MGIAVVLYPVFITPAVATLALAGCGMAALALGLITLRWLGAGIAAGVALVNYALALLNGARQPDVYAPALAVASWLLLELFDLSVMVRRGRGRGRIENEVIDAHRRRLISTSGAAGLASVAVLLAGVLFHASSALLPAAALAAAAVLVTGVALTRRAMN
ncbi:MAG: hypothetical protein M3360_00025 [Actinomycetota bacterium]|nr:hypothetical protein [Actinomycetota bacterium]